MVRGLLRFVRQKLGASDWFAPSLLFLLIGMVILGPALKPGFIFLLDMPWPQKFQLSDYTAGHAAHYPLIFVLALLNKFIAAWLLQKILLVAIILLAGVGMYRLQRHRHISRGGRYVSAFVFALNPYVLERLVAGQWLVLLGYAFAPVFVLALLRFAEQPQRKHGLRLLMLYGLYPILSIHWWYIATLFTLPGALRWLTRYAGKTYRRPNTWQIPRYWPGVVVMIVVVVALNWGWLTSIISGSSKLNHITTADFRAFATDGSGMFGAIINVVSLYGFWQTAVTLPREAEMNAWLYPLLLLVITALGVWHAWRRQKYYTAYLVVVGIVAIILAAGFGSPLTMPFTSVLVRIVPGYSGLRDTAKLVGVIAFVYAWFLPAGLLVVKQQLRKLWSVLGSARAVQLSFVGVYGVLMLGGLWGVNAQLHAYWYPQGWAEAQTLLQVRGAKKIVVVPWRGYLQLQFANQAYVANPARLYFTPEVLQSNAVNNVLIDQTRQTSDFDTIATVLHSGHAPAALSLYRQQGVDHLVILKTADWQAYASRLGELKALYEDNSIAVYEL